MKLPIIEGVIKRRILVNFRVEPEVIQNQLPSHPFWALSTSGQWIDLQERDRFEKSELVEKSPSEMI
jgi:hypothetical protein